MAPPEEEPVRSAPPPIPPLIAWASRNSGVIFLVLLFSVAMIEGVAIYASKRAAAATTESPRP
jgi:hypothetical protein